MKALFLACAFACPSYLLSATVSAPSGEWTALLGDFDFVDDQPNGLMDANIVGSGEDYGLFVTHNDNGLQSRTDGTFGFRLRLDGPGGTKNATKYERAAYLGIDADFNDTIDVFIGVNFSGSKQELGIFAAGLGMNNTSGSTSVGSLVTTYAVNTSNYSYREVSYMIDGGTTNDLNPGNKGQNDYYLSMLVNFADIVSYLSDKGILITDQSALRLVASTSNNGNTLNQDIAGINGAGSATSTWSQVGAFSQNITVAGNPIVQIPEPGQLALLALGTLVLLRRKR